MKYNKKDVILPHLLIFMIVFLILTGIIVFIQHEWVSFFEYGWEWNSNTMPPLVWWTIFLRVLPSSILISFITSIIGYPIGILIIKKVNGV